ncbi:MAG TPA: hypothetical protein VFY45_21420 [Baekduia sp.]|nr:hypothetical protein [Baekduia sp.]
MLRRLMGPLVIVMALLGSASAADAAIPQPVYFWESTAATIAGPGQQSLPPVVRPKAIALFADGSWDVEQLRWSGWGSSVARATGISSASNGIPNQAEGKRIRSAARVTLSKPGTFEGREVYRCFTLTIASRPASNQHLCLKQEGDLWYLAAKPSTPRRPTATTDFLARSIGGGCSMSTLQVTCETYGTSGQVATLKPSGAVTICVLRGNTNSCGQGDFGEHTPHYGGGKNVTVGRFRCHVSAAGVRCTVATTGKGFLISKTETKRVGPS